MLSLKANRKYKWLRGHLLFWCFSAETSCWSSRDGDSLVASVAILGFKFFLSIYDQAEALGVVPVCVQVSSCALLYFKVVVDIFI